MTLVGVLGFSTMDMTMLLKSMWLVERAEAGEAESRDTGPE